MRATVDCPKGRSDEFRLMERLLNKYIELLNLDVVEKHELLTLIHRQINVAECDAFRFGFYKGEMK